MYLYKLYRESFLDSLIIFVFLLYTLHCLIDVNISRRNRYMYMIAGSLTFFLLYNVTSYLGIFVEYLNSDSIASHPYWYYFLCTFLIAAVFAHFYLDGHLFAKITFILYYISILQLYQIICSPLYKAVGDLSPKQFMIWDIITTLIRYLLLYLFSVFSKKNRIDITSIQYKPRYLLMLLFPVSLIVYYQLAMLYPNITVYSEPILAAIVLPNLLVMYYLFSSVVRSYEQRELLTEALYETKNQMARYRYSIEVEERVKKERHELKNNYLYIQSLLKLGQYERLETYLSEHIEVKMEALSSISTGNLMIDYLVNRKTEEARKKNIKVYTEVLVPEHMPVNEENFCTIFLNLIDNAIEASQSEINPDIQITLKTVNNYLCCSIANKINPKRIQYNPDFETTKPDPSHHGLGRIIVKETIESCNGIFQDSLEGNYYTAKFMLPLS